MGSRRVEPAGTHAGSDGLEDKSIATINSASRIDVAFAATQRKVNLRAGEAWFEVAKDKSKPFIVITADTIYIGQAPGKDQRSI